MRIKYEVVERPLLNKNKYHKKYYSNSSVYGDYEVEDKYKENIYRMIWLMGVDRKVELITELINGNMDKIGNHYMEPKDSECFISINEGGTLFGPYRRGHGIRSILIDLFRHILEEPKIKKFKEERNIASIPGYFMNIIASVNPGRTSWVEVIDLLADVKLIKNKKNYVDLEERKIMALKDDKIPLTKDNDEYLFSLLQDHISREFEYGFKSGEIELDKYRYSKLPASTYIHRMFDEVYTALRIESGMRLIKLVRKSNKYFRAEELVTRYRICRFLESKGYKLNKKKLKESYYGIDIIKYGETLHDRYYGIKEREEDYERFSRDYE